MKDKTPTSKYLVQVETASLDDCTRTVMNTFVYQTRTPAKAHSEITNRLSEIGIEDNQIINLSITSFSIIQEL